MSAVVAPMLLSRREAAEALGVSLRHLQTHVLPHIRVVRTGRRVLVRVADLERWIAEHQDR